MIALLCNPGTETLWAGRLTQSPGAQDLHEPALIILAAVFRPHGLGTLSQDSFHHHLICKALPPSVLVWRAKLRHHNYLSDKVTSH